MSLSDYPGRKQGCVYHIDGYHGRSLDVYPNKCVFTIVPGLHSAGHGEFEVGEKTVWFKDTCSMFYHRSTGSYGWLVLEPYNSSSSYPSSHTFLYSEKEISNKDMDNLIAYINQQMDLIKGCPDSAPSCRADLKKEERLIDKSDNTHVELGVDSSKPEVKEYGINPNGEKAFYPIPVEGTTSVKCPKCNAVQPKGRHICWKCSVPFMY